MLSTLVPTGLLALQGADIPGRLIRNKMNQLNISKDFIQGEVFFWMQIEMDVFDVFSVILLGTIHPLPNASRGKEGTLICYTIV